LLIQHGTAEIEHISKLETGELETNEVHLATFICTHIHENEIVFENVNYGLIYETFLIEMEKGVIPEINSFLSHENEGVRNAVTALLSDPYQLSENWKIKYKVNAKSKDQELKLLADRVIDRLKQKHILKMMHSVHESMKNCNDDEQLNYLLMEYKLLHELKENLFKETGTIITH
jgi:hypothetical protein